MVNKNYITDLVEINTRANEGCDTPDAAYGLTMLGAHYSAAATAGIASDDITVAMVVNLFVHSLTITKNGEEQDMLDELLKAISKIRETFRDKDHIIAAVNGATDALRLVSVSSETKED